MSLTRRPVVPCTCPAMITLFGRSPAERPRIGRHRRGSAEASTAPLIRKATGVGSMPTPRHPWHARCRVMPLRTARAMSGDDLQTHFLHLKFRHKDSMPGRPSLSSGLPHLPPPIAGEDTDGGEPRSACVPSIPTFPHTGGKGARAGSSPQPGKRSSGHFLMSEFQHFLHSVY
jgi:hypothetical protein